MYTTVSQKYKKSIKIIHPGEFHASDRDELIGTLLGSCIAVCLHDSFNGISGMNHFMLPGRVEGGILSDPSGRYGVIAVNELLCHLRGLGAEGKYLTAKIFGGGHVVDTEMKYISIPEDNIKIAKIMMEMEDITIVKMDVGSNYTRKILMDVKSGNVFLKKIVNANVLDMISRRDMEYKNIRLKGIAGHSST